jgi:hypothetical protein
MDILVKKAKVECRLRLQKNWKKTIVPIVGEDGQQILQFIFYNI